MYLFNISMLSAVCSCSQFFVTRLIIEQLKLQFSDTTYITVIVDVMSNANPPQEVNGEFTIRKLMYASDMGARW
jgi:hypothetical protein